MKKKILSTLFAFALLSGSAAAQDKPMHEVYSMMVYNFVKYIQWPNQGGEFVIAIVGNDQMYDMMSKTYTGSKFGGSTCVVKKYKSASEVGDVQVVFIDKSRSGELDAINSKLKGKHGQTCIVFKLYLFQERGSG